MITVAFSALAWAAAVVAAVHATWWLLLSLVALPAPRSLQRRTGPVRFVTIVPAHNEERHVARTVTSLLTASATTPVLVVADNCTDQTAQRARGAGAAVVQRVDSARRGKSYALDYGIAAVRAGGAPPDAVVIVDADTIVSRSFYRGLSGALSDGAAAAQVHYAVASPDAALARLRSVAFRLIHWSRPLGAARIGVPTSLKGNGMALRWDLVERGYGGSGLAEDASLTIELARRGVAVRFVAGATVWGEMAATYGAARTQDERWETGRMGLARRSLAAAAHGLVRGRVGLFAAMVDLAALPLTLVAALAVLAAAGAVAGLLPLVVGIGPAILLVAYVATGLLAARTPLEELAALTEAPRFVLHKLRAYARMLMRRGPAEWQRTSR